jgi:hypothetical protein
MSLMVVPRACGLVMRLRGVRGVAAVLVAVDEVEFVVETSVVGRR